MRDLCIFGETKYSTWDVDQAPYLGDLIYGKPVVPPEPYRSRTAYFEDGYRGRKMTPTTDSALLACYAEGAEARRVYNELHETRGVNGMAPDEHGKRPHNPRGKDYCRAPVLGGCTRKSKASGSNGRGSTLCSTHSKRHQRGLPIDEQIEGRPVRALRTG